MKDKFEGTKGPWSAVDNGVFFDICSADGEFIGNTCASQHSFDGGDRNGAITRKNSQLISAAPELFEALRQLRDYVEDVCAVSSDDCHDDHPLNLANKAINKALGKE